MIGLMIKWRAENKTRGRGWRNS